MDHERWRWYCLGLVPAQFHSSQGNISWRRVDLMIADALLSLFGTISLLLSTKRRINQKRAITLGIFVFEGAYACMWVCVSMCVNGKLKPLQLCLPRPTAPRLHVFGQHVEPRARPLLTNTPAAVYHAGSGVEDSSPPVRMPSYQPTLSRSS